MSLLPGMWFKRSGRAYDGFQRAPYRKNKKDPWASILQQTECASCKNIIPDHLGDRWDNMSIEEAQKEWKEIYRKQAAIKSGNNVESKVKIVYINNSPDLELTLLAGTLNTTLKEAT